MNERKQIALISIVSVLLTVVFTILVFTFICIYYYGFEVDNQNYYSPDNFKLYFYGDITDAYQTDKEVIKVYELCLDSEIKSICVYENIEFFWSNSFESFREDYFFSPTEMVKHEGYGVCRDIAVFRMAVFKKLNINAEFVFIPEHIYIRTFENGITYELDNDNLRTK